MSDLVRSFELKKGDFVVVTGNFNRYILSQKRADKNYDANEIIDEILSTIGKSGTLVFQAFSWDFCHADGFDMKATKSKTGALSNLALNRSDFKRTKHPIYSFAVAGKFQNELVSLANISAFGKDSPFAFMHEKRAKMIVANLPLNHSFTFVHYAEQMCGVSYRFEKNFKGPYTDENGVKNEREYSMFVRRDGVKTQLDGLEKILIKNSAMKQNFGLDEIKIIDLAAAFELIKDDILKNNARNLVEISSS